MRCQLGRKPFETLIVIQPDTSHEYDQLDPTLIITDIPSPEDIVLSKEDMKKTAIIIDDFEMSRLNKVQRLLLLPEEKRGVEEMYKEGPKRCIIGAEEVLKRYLRGAE